MSAAERTGIAPEDVQLSSRTRGSGAQRGRRVLGRLGGGLVVVWAAATLTFVAMRIMPGDLVTAILGGPTQNATPEARQAVVEEYGLDQPILVQYVDFLRRTLTGDFGTSYVFRQDVGTLVAERAGATVALALAALVLGWVIAVLTILLTAGRGRVLSGLGSGAEILAVSTPQLWLAIVLLVAFAFGLGWFPVAGGNGVGALVLPSLALAIPLAGYFGQVTRDAMESALEQPFVVTARARGLSDAAVRVRHVLRHAALPGITVSGYALGWLFGGAVVVESVFGRPGLGVALLRGVQGQDIPLTGAIVLISAVVYVVANLVVDLLYPLVDPRIRLP